MADAFDPKALGFRNHRDPVLRREHVSRLPRADRALWPPNQSGEARVAKPGNHVAEVHGRINLRNADRESRRGISDLQINALHNAGMDDQTKHERLREARARRYRTAKEAAEAIGVPYGTYSGHEAGSRGFDDEEARRYARFFRISAGGLVFGEKENMAPAIVPFGGKIGAGGSIDTSSSQDEPGVAYEIETIAKFPEAVIAYQVVGESMLPIYEPDTVILCRAHTQNLSAHIGQRLAVGTVEHGRQLKILHEGSRPDLYDLESINRTVPTLRNVQVEWVARICAIIPADEWHIIERKIRAEEQQRNRLKKPSQRHRESAP